MRVLIYGAGVIGSIFAGKLAQSGCDVTVLARGDRLEQIKQKGITLQKADSDRHEVSWVKVIEHLAEDDVYDYVLVVMQRTQVDVVLTTLSKNRSPNFVFVVNTSADHASWAEAVGPERLMIGFPAAGGERKDGIVRYFIVKGLMRTFQTTTFGEYEGITTPRLMNLVRLFKKAGIPSVTNRNMDAWQKTHVSLITSIANALYKHDGSNYSLARSWQDIHLMIDGVKEGFSALRTLGFDITPRKLNYFRLPTPVLTLIFKLVMGTKLAEITMAKHTLSAKAELIALQEEYDALLKRSGIMTPAIDSLRTYLHKKQNF